ncbi:acetoin utilization protein AcuC [Paenibacillus protaetiae]|uniref:Acetoin utilization protein AcuC n=1 Tax=Paenibacillus protaetiae TaxID=2509456 RepID=A0A4P6ETU2_9BACL|nr:acetoin utilization protein AcuC [Paenibacillus protaetiae]QAY65483.1 acetoin utilization protein AcuC [Paenibacillus protaetiae]
MPYDAVFVHHPDSARYQFAVHHPFDPLRLTLSQDLLSKTGALPAQLMMQPSACSDEETERLLRLVHRDDYIGIVRQLSSKAPPQNVIAQAEQYGLGTEDTPYFEGMHDAAAAIVAGSTAAADAVMKGHAAHAYHMGGGLHHGFPHKAAGFCVYNDTAITIKHLQARYGARVLYIDTDVHHGDGVQWAFYDDPDICTYSIHETGKYLFPGTGFVYEKGSDRGFGATFNIPLEPYTEDDSWIESFQSTIGKVAKAFKPDIIVSQHGCDAHAFDPLSHMYCSTRIYYTIPKLIHELAHQYAGGRWVALGGGGYDIWRVVPRAWALVWLAMTDHPLIAEIGADESSRRGGAVPTVRLPSSWTEAWAAQSPVPLPLYWMDDLSEVPPIPRRAEIERKNRDICQIAVQDL